MVEEEEEEEDREVQVLHQVVEELALEVVVMVDITQIAIYLLLLKMELLIAVVEEGVERL